MSSCFLIIYLNDYKLVSTTGSVKSSGGEVID